MTYTRRNFLKASLHTAGALGALTSFGRMSAFAASGGPYQALVCINLAGGNDGHNSVIPITTAQQNYALYQKNRQTLAIAQKNLLTIANGADTYGLHPSLKEIRALYQQGHAAVLANVGNLVQPVTRAEVLGGNPALVPTALLSHSDQTSQWQSGSPTGTAPNGWGGRMIDQLSSQNGSAIFPAITSTGGCGLFCAGQSGFPATVPPPYGGSAPTSMATLDGGRIGAATLAAQQQLLSFDNGLQLVQSANGVVTRGQNYSTTLTQLLQNNKITTQFPSDNPLAAQLKVVANMMAVRNSLGVGRQVFYCQLGGFDSHSDQLQSQAMLLTQLSMAVGAFYQALQELGIEQNVTAFTTSEFGRTLNPSGSDGSDHAWGNHHFIIGGSVNGGRFYGSFPSLALGGPQDANSRGTLIPTTGVAQYGATLAQWFGVSSSSLATVFPNIGNFGSANLGFLT